MERLHHRLELTHLLAVGARRREALVGREEAQGVVAPVVGQPAFLQEAFGHRLVHREQLDAGHAQIEQVLDHRGVGQAGVAAAQRLGHLGVEPGEALDVQLVHDGLAPDDLRPLVSAPVEVVVHHHAARRSVGGVAGVEQVDPALLVPEDRRAPVGLAGEGPRVRVHHQLVGVEAVAFLRGPRPVHPEAVQRPGAQAGQVSVEDVIGLIPQREPGDLLRGLLGVEEAQLHRGGVVGGEREIDALAIARRSQRVRNSRPNVEAGHHGRHNNLSPSPQLGRGVSPRCVTQRSLGRPPRTRVLPSETCAASSSP